MVTAVQQFVIVTADGLANKHTVLLEKANEFLENFPGPVAEHTLSVCSLADMKDIEDISGVSIREAKDLLSRPDVNTLAFVRRGPGWYRAIFLEALLVHDCEGVADALRDLHDELKERNANLEDTVARVSEQASERVEATQSIVPAEPEALPIEGDAYLEMRAENNALHKVVVNLFREASR